MACPLKALNWASAVGLSLPTDLHVVTLTSYPSQTLPLTHCLPLTLSPSHTDSFANCLGCVLRIVLLQRGGGVLWRRDECERGVQRARG